MQSLNRETFSRLKFYLTMPYRCSMIYVMVFLEFIGPSSMRRIDGGKLIPKPDFDLSSKIKVHECLGGIFILG